MNTYEKLLDKAAKENVSVIESYDFSGTRLKGLYCDGTVALSDDLKTQSEKACVLAEELGHHYTTIGDIIDQSNASNRKQELHARLWAYNRMIGLMGFIKAYEHGCRNRYEMAEYLEVTEEFLQEALSAYRDKYGICKEVDNYIIFFEPQFAVMKKFTD